MWNMIENFIRSLAVWHSSMTLMNANKLTPVSTPHYLRHRLENAMVSTLNSSDGLFIHWGLYGSGKSVAVRHAAQRLQDDHGRTVIFRWGYDLRGLFDPNCDLYTRLGLPSSELALFDSKPTTLIIDHFDTFVWYPAKKNELLMRSLLGMVAQARHTPNFNMLLVFNSWESVREFKDRCGPSYPRLVADPGLGRWTKDELTALRDITPIRSSTTDDKYDEILNLSIIGGSPSMLHDALNKFETLKATRARSFIYEYEWTQGILALTGCTPTGPGRFPDKDGNFHWDAGRIVDSECRQVKTGLQ
jgi:hypothetical protein